MKDDEMLSESNWSLFRKSGLLFLTNQFLHIFGWCIVFEFDDPISAIPSRVYPSRTKFRGFGEKQIDEGYKAITQYMDDNSKELLDEVMD